MANSQHIEDTAGEEEVEFTKVTIAMPKWMHNELRQRARRRGISVTELMRRAVALDAVVFDPNHPDREVILRENSTPASQPGSHPDNRNKE